MTHKIYTIIFFFGIVLLPQNFYAQVDFNKRPDDDLGNVEDAYQEFFFEALKQSIGALTVSLFTPNRIGDYGAKALYYNSSYRKRIVLLNFIGNVMQMTITVLFGSIGFYFFGVI